MRSVDSNILLRLILRDDPQQYDVALDIFRSPVFISQTVLLEVSWVLGETYGLVRQDMAKVLLGILDAPSVTILNEAATRWALTRHSAVKSDLADLLHLAQSYGTERFATFDRKLAAQAGAESPVPVETHR